MTGSRTLDKGWGRRITNIYESCYLHIKCFPTNSLAALMWRWYLNSERAALQLWVESSRKCEMGQEEAPETKYTCMVKMILKSWYIAWEGDQEKEIGKTLEKKIRELVIEKRTLCSWLNYLDRVTQVTPRTIFVSYILNTSSKP